MVSDKYLMVIGGYGESGYSNRVELVSLEEDKPVPSCLQNLRDFPIEADRIIGGPVLPGETRILSYPPIMTQVLREYKHRYRHQAVKTVHRPRRSSPSWPRSP